MISRFCKSHILVFPPNFVARTNLMLQKLTLPLNKDYVLSSAANPATTPCLCIISYHTAIASMMLLTLPYRCLHCNSLTSVAAATATTTNKKHLKYLSLLLEQVLHHTHMFFEIDELNSRQRFCEYVCNPRLCGNILSLDRSMLYTIFDEMTPNIYVFQPVMTHWILRKLNATMIIIVYIGRIHPLPEQAYQQLLKPDSFTHGCACFHILCFCRAQCYSLLLPTTPRNHH